MESLDIESWQVVEFSLTLRFRRILFLIEEGWFFL
jgi:hypothetical protein